MDAGQASPQIDASAGLSESERAQVKEIKRLMADGSWGIGNTIPRKLLAAVYDGAIPQGMQLDLAPAVSMNASMDVQNRLAAKVEQSLQASLATDVAPPRRLATDGPQQRPPMSYKLKQLMEDYTWLNEDAFEAQMQKWGLTEPRDRIQYKNEAMALGVMSPRGTSLADQQKARAYLKKPDVNASHAVATPPGKRGFLKELGLQALSAVFLR